MIKGVANKRARMVFYGMRTIGYGRAAKSHKFIRHYVAVESPDVVVKIILEVPNDWHSRKRRININEVMHAMAKKYYPKAEIFMFYNRVSCQGILPPPELRPRARKQFEAHKCLP